jgi:hypothetical protein
MTLAQFRASLADAHPPRELGLALAGLWWDAKGDWNRAHESAQQDEGAAGAWVHAYLHRKEGDLPNAQYWYRRAGKSPAHVSGQNSDPASFAREWDEIASALLAA